MKLCVLCNGKALIISLCATTMAGVYILLLPYTLCTYTPLRRTVNIRTHLWQTSPRGGCPTLAMQPSLSKLCHPMKQHLLFGSERKDECLEACRVTKEHSRGSLDLRTWSTAKRWQSDFIRGLQLSWCVITAACLLACKPHQVHLLHVTRAERERWNICIHWSIPLVTYHMTYGIQGSTVRSH